jgi:site-specific DNA recombinase
VQTPLRVLGYARVSTAEQARDGVSLPAQSEKIRQFARLHDLDLVEVIEDPGASAKTLDRPGLSRALAMLDAGEAGGLIVAKLDRLTRSVVDLARLAEGYFGGDHPKGQLLSVSDSIDTRTAAGRMVLNIITTIAQWERETIVELTLDAMRHKKSKGEACGNPPFGSQVDPRDPRRSKGGLPVALIPCQEELEALALMRSLANRGWTLRAIAAELDRRGFKPRRGGASWARSTVSDLLARPDLAPIGEDN